MAVKPHDFEFKVGLLKKDFFERPGRCMVLKISRERYNDRGHPACRVLGEHTPSNYQGQYAIEHSFENIFQVFKRLFSVFAILRVSPMYVLIHRR